MICLQLSPGTQMQWEEDGAHPDVGMLWEPLQGGEVDAGGTGLLFTPLPQ